MVTEMTISKAAKKAGVGVETIRFYERKGLIKQPPRPMDGGFRVYPEETVACIRFIRQAQEIGFSLREIEELMSLRADRSADCSEVRERAAAKLEEVDEKLDQLGKIRSALNELIAVCPGRGALRACTIMEFLISASEETSTSEKVNNEEHAR